MAAEIKVQVCVPYIDKSKAWIARKGNDMDVVLSQTWSCYRGGEVPCGECEACKKREAALAYSTTHNHPVFATLSERDEYYSQGPEHR